MKPAFILSIVLLLVACSSMHSSDPRATVNPKLDPKAVPEQRPVFEKQQRVLVLTFLATNDGYSIEKSAIAVGSPSQMIDLNRDVLITAYGANGEVVARASVFNPREVHTTGSKRPETAVLDKGHLTVSLPSPEMIKRLDIEVRRGPNEALKQSFRPADKDVVQPDGSRTLFVPD